MKTSADRLLNVPAKLCTSAAYPRKTDMNKMFLRLLQPWRQYRCILLALNRSPYYPLHQLGRVAIVHKNLAQFGNLVSQPGSRTNPDQSRSQRLNQIYLVARRSERVLPSIYTSERGLPIDRTKQITSNTFNKYIHERKAIITFPLNREFQCRMHAVQNLKE